MCYGWQKKLLLPFRDINVKFVVACLESGMIFGYIFPVLVSRAFENLKYAGSVNERWNFK
jgi:hypothetical protein